MRTTFHEQLNAFTTDLLILCDSVETSLHHASQALLTGAQDSADTVITETAYREKIRQRCEKRAVELLALDGPVARDLRQVISSIYIVESLARMGNLAQHIAALVIRRRPEPIIPSEYLNNFVDMDRMCAHMTSTLHQLIEKPNADDALNFEDDDDTIDTLSAHIMHRVTSPDWIYSARTAVDLASLCRYYERYADHAVKSSARIIYLCTGYQTKEYLNKQTESVEQWLANL